MAEYTPPKVYRAKDRLPAEHLNALNSAVADHGTRVSEVEQSVVGKADQSSVNDALALKADATDLENIDGSAGAVASVAKDVAFGKDQPVGVILGSSSIFGSGVAPVADRPTARFARRLERQLQLTHGVPEDRAPFSMIAGDVDAGYSNGGASLVGGLGKFSRILKDGETLTLKSPYPSTGIWVGFREGSSVGNITVSINGGDPTPVTVGKTGSSTWSGSYKSPTVPRGMNTYTFTVSGGSQVFDFVHFYDDTNSEGPILLNGGWGESTLGTLMDQQSTTDRVKSINPDFIIVVTGSNEQGNGTTRAEFEDMVSRFNKMVESNTTGPTWLFYVPNARPNTPGYDRRNITEVVKAAVEQAPVTRSYSSALEHFWTDLATDKGVLGTLYTDNVHPSRVGHAGIARKIGDALGIRPGRGTVPQSVFTGADVDPAPVEVEAPPEDPFTVWTSDSFDSGELAGRSTDAANGGTSQPYDLSLVKTSVMENGALTLGSSSSAVFLTPAADDVEASVVYRGQVGNQGWMRVRVGTKAASPRDCVGVRFTRTGDTSANVQVDQKVDNTTSILSPSSVPVQAGQTVTVRAVGDQVTLLVDGAEKQTVTTGAATGDHVQVLGYNTTLTVDDLTIRTIEGE